MDRLKFGTRELMGTARQTSVWTEGTHVSALELTVEGEVTREDLAAMTACPLEIVGENGETQGVHEGYTVLYRHSVVLAKEDETKKKLEEAERENAALLYRLLTGEDEQ